MWVRHGSVSFHLRRGWRIPCLRLQPPRPGLHIGLSTQRLHHGPSVHQLRRVSSSLRHRLGQSSTRHRLRTPLLWLHFIDPSHWLCWAPPSLQLHLVPLLLRLHHCLPDPLLCLGYLRHLLRLGSPDPPHQPGSTAFCLYPRLLSHLLRHCRWVPWSRQPFLHYGS